MYLNLTSLHFIQDRIFLFEKACDFFFLPLICHTLKSVEKELHKALTYQCYMCLFNCEIQLCVLRNSKKIPLQEQANLFSGKD